MCRLWHHGAESTLGGRKPRNTKTRQGRASDIRRSGKIRDCGKHEFPKIGGRLQEISCHGFAWPLSGRAAPRGSSRPCRFHTEKADFMHPTDNDLLAALEARKGRPSAEMQRIAAVYAARRETATRLTPKPAHWLKPPYGSQQYRYAVSMGWISDEEHKADHEAHRSRRERGRASAGTSAAEPSRFANSPPPETRQYGTDYSTEAARDTRLSMGAKALLQIIRARCGKGHKTAFTKATIGNMIGRSARTVQRYVAELQRFGYIKTETRRGWGGLHSGLIVWITEKVRPFYAQHDALAAWMADQVKTVTRGTVKNLGFLGRTNPSHTNQKKNYPYKELGGIGLAPDKLALFG